MRSKLQEREARLVQPLRDDLAAARRERDEALAALQATGERADALRRQLALLKQAGPPAREAPAAPAVDPGLDPAVRAERLVAAARDSAAGAGAAGLLRLVRLDAALADLRALEQRREQVLDELARLSAALERPALPQQRATDSDRHMSFG